MAKVKDGKIVKDEKEEKTNFLGGKKPFSIKKGKTLKQQRSDIIKGRSDRLKSDAKKQGVSVDELKKKRSDTYSTVLAPLTLSPRVRSFIWASQAGWKVSKFLTGTANVEKLIANVVYTFIILFGLMTAIDKLEFTKLSEIMNTVVHLSGNILFGLIILAIGNWLANLAANNFAKGDNNTFIANIIKIAILAIFLAIGLRRMGIADDIINLAFGITLSAIALTIVLAFGLGGREAAGKQMEKILNKFNKN